MSVNQLNGKVGCMKWIKYTWYLYLILELAMVWWVIETWGFGIFLMLCLMNFVLGLLLIKASRAGLTQIKNLFQQRQNVGLYQALLPVRCGLAVLLLMAPGLLNSGLAIVLLLPWKGSSAWFLGQRSATKGADSHTASNPDGDIIDVDFTDVTSQTEVVKITHRTNDASES
jgi:UPF0716 protein FxsA